MSKKISICSIFCIFVGCAFVQPTPSTTTLVCDDSGTRCAYYPNERVPEILAQREKEKKFQFIEDSCWKHNSLKDCYEDGIARKTANYSSWQIIESFQRACESGDQRGCNAAKKEVERNQVHKGKCYFSYPFQCVVNQMIDKKHVGLVCSTWSGMMQEPGKHNHGILEVLQMREFFSMQPLNTGFQLIGTKNLQLENGSNAEFDLWKECYPAKYQIGES